MNRRVSAGAPLAVALALFLPLLCPVSASGADGKALFEKKCSVCHGLNLATGRREWKPEWRGIVDRMVRKRDGWISAEEAAAIVDYLGSEYGRD
jgi:mono/diheme cytochrome c family protein